MLSLTLRMLYHFTAYVHRCNDLTDTVVFQDNEGVSQLTGLTEDLSY